MKVVVVKHASNGVGICARRGTVVYVVHIIVVDLYVVAPSVDSPTHVMKYVVIDPNACRIEELHRIRASLIDAAV
jgi:hypothetical protein